MHQTENQQQFPLKFENQLLKLIFFNHLVIALNDLVEKLSPIFIGLREGKCLFLICFVNLVFKGTRRATDISISTMKVQIPSVYIVYFDLQLFFSTYSPLNVSLLFSSTHIVLLKKKVLYIQKIFQFFILLIYFLIPDWFIVLSPPIF